MHESGALSWREVVDQHHSALVDELSTRLDSDLQDAVSRALAAERLEASTQLNEACEDARRSQVESLNQVLRRLRSASEEKVLDLVAEGCASYAGHLVVLVFESNQARSAASFGIAEHGLSFDTDSAPAVVAAVDSRDPMVALATEAEISAALAQAFGSVPDAKAYLFPIVARHTVVAMLIASGAAASSGAPAVASGTAPMELLCEAAGMRLEAFHQVSSPLPGLPGGNAAPPTWDGLTDEDRKLHLQAQRMARLRVAEMRLYHEDELRGGAEGSDIYGALQKEIDAAREQFLQTFLAKSATMVDYLHLEVLRSLAQDDDRLLGHGYPGPMV